MKIVTKNGDSFRPAFLAVLYAVVFVFIGLAQSSLSIDGEPLFKVAILTKYALQLVATGAEHRQFVNKFQIEFFIILPEEKHFVNKNAIN